MTSRDGEDSLPALLELFLDEPEDDLGRVLRQAHVLLLKHPVAARAAFRAIAAEGRRFAETDEGKAWKERLVGSELVRRGRSVWEIATLGMLDENPARLLPTQFVDALCYAAGLSDLEILAEHVRCYIDFTGETRDAMVVTVREANNIPEWYRPGFLDEQRTVREAEVNLLIRIRPELTRSEARYICTNVFQGLISSSVYLYPADSENRRLRLSAMAMAALLA